jgi:hypothetical protein
MEGFLCILWMNGGMCESHGGRMGCIVGGFVVCDLSAHSDSYGLTNTTVLSECQEVFVERERFLQVEIREGVVAIRAYGALTCATRSHVATHLYKPQFPPIFINFLIIVHHFY